MPISNKGTSLRVETVIGDKTYKDEEVRDVYYPRNQQREQRRIAGSHPKDVKVYGRPNPQQEEFEIEPQMQAAIDADLADKGVTPKPKRTRKKKTTTTNEQTDDQS